MEDDRFWLAMDQLASEHPVVVDRAKGTPHPRYPDFIYPLDYGYLEGTTSGDGAGVDVWGGQPDGERGNGCGLLRGRCQRRCGDEVAAKLYRG